jgi:hypothetical protein
MCVNSKISVVFVFFPVAQQLKWAYAASLLRFLDITQTYTEGGAPQKERSAHRKRRYLHNTQ